jgi:hypothetical protein
MRESRGPHSLDTTLDKRAPFHRTDDLFPKRSQHCEADLRTSTFLGWLSLSNTWALQRKVGKYDPALAPGNP